MSGFTGGTEGLANQQALNKMSDKLGGRIPVRIHFLDNSSKMLLVDSGMQAKDVMKTLLEKYEVHDIEHVVSYFGLFESKNGSSIDSPLPLDAEVASVVNGWTDENSKLVFMIRLYMPCTWSLQHKDVIAASVSKPKSMLSVEAYLGMAEVIDPNMLHLQYIQAVYHVITGQYPTTQEQALILGSLHFLYKFGEYCPSRHKAGFLGNRIVEFIPFRYLKKKSLEEWETALFSSLRDHQSALLSLSGSASDNGHLAPNSLAPQHHYMDYVFRFPNHIFGSTFFRCATTKQKGLPDTVIVGIHADGLSIFDKSSERKLIKKFSMQEMLRWGFKTNILFFLEIQETEDFGPVIELKSGDCEKMSDLLTDYSLACMKERDREAERAKTLNIISVEEYVKREKELNELSMTAPIIPKLAKKKKSTSDGANGSTAFSENEQIAAAVMIQALYRGYSLRCQWLYEDAAIRIQSVYRGYRARVAVFEMIEELMESGNLSM